MKTTTIARVALAIVLAVLAILLVRYRAIEKRNEPAAAAARAIAPPKDAAAATAVATTPVDAPGFIYGRVTTTDGATHEGRLRWGGAQEAFWSDFFNGVKHQNPWAAQVPAERLPKDRQSFEVFGLELGHRDTPVDMRRPFVTRFGDIARIEAQGREVRVTLKSGSVFELNRFDASDFDDGVRVWDGTGGVLDFDSMQVRSIELLPTARLGDPPARLHGTVRTRQGEFAGFLRWDQEDCLGTDELNGESAGGELAVRFDTIRAIERRPGGGCQVTTLDGRQLEISGTAETGDGNRGMYVDDPRFGRVLISWRAFERVDFTPDGSGPAYGDFPAGSPLQGSVTTRAGARLAGRLVFDLDESETTETCDASVEGLDYTIPFGLIASIVPASMDERDPKRARVKLHSGEELQLAPTGDLGKYNAGVLIFVEGGLHPEYVPWPEVARVEFERPKGTAGNANKGGS